MHRKFRVIFKGEIDPNFDWKFEPIQDELVVNAGETALAFYKAFNKEEKPLIGKKIFSFKVFIIYFCSTFQ